jgi:hypothetical protein
MKYLAFSLSSFSVLAVLVLSYRLNKPKKRKDLFLAHGFSPWLLDSFAFGSVESSSIFGW